MTLTLIALYSAFIAAKVLALDDARVTPAHRLADGTNYVPTNKSIVFGHHCAAITGAGPLVGPTLAVQLRLGTRLPVRILGSAAIGDGHVPGSRTYC